MLSILEYVASVFGLTVLAWIIFRIVARHSYLRKGQLTWFATSLEFLIFSLFGTFTWIDLPSGWPPAYVNPILRTIGLLLIVIGLTVMFVLIFWFGWLRAMGQKVDALRQSGPYRITRNPQLAACIIAVIGYALLWPSWHTLGWIALFLFIAHMMVVTEEEHLGKIFGEEYVQYCDRVPRYIGLGKT